MLADGIDNFSHGSLPIESRMLCSSCVRALCTLFGRCLFVLWVCVCVCIKYCFGTRHHNDNAADLFALFQYNSVFTETISGVFFFIIIIFVCIAAISSEIIELFCGKDFINRFNAGIYDITMDNISYVNCCLIICFCVIWNFRFFSRNYLCRPHE